MDKIGRSVDGKWSYQKALAAFDHALHDQVPRYLRYRATGPAVSRNWPTFWARGNGDDLLGRSDERVKGVF